MAVAQLTPQLNNESISLLKNLFNNSFNDLLKQVDHEYSDGVSLAPIDQTNVYISDVFQPLVLPSCFILVGETDIKYDSDPNFIKASTNVTVVVSFEGVGYDNLMTLAFRYMRALYAVYNLKDLVSNDGRVKIKTVPQRFGYSDPVKTKLDESGQFYRKDCVLELEVKHYEKNLI